MPIQHFSTEKPLRINESGISNPTVFKPAYTAFVFCREAFEAQSRTVQKMRIERDAEDSRETRRRCFGENKGSRRSWSEMGRFEHVSRERELGAKSVRDTQRRKDRSVGKTAQAYGERRSSVSLLQLSKQRNLVRPNAWPLAAL